METRRYILAIGLSMLVLVTYFHFFAPQPPVEQAPPEQQPAARETVQEKAPAPAKVRPAVVPAVIPVAAKGREIVIATDVLKAVVNTAGGVITKWELKQYREASKEEVGVGALWRKLTGPAQEAKPKRARRPRVRA